jgi:sec-independent protein translocase protein TatA
VRNKSLSLNRKELPIFSTGVFMLGWQEMILVFAILLLVFGPTKLPKIARELGKAWNEFNKAS